MAGVFPFGTPLISNEHFVICLTTTLTISLFAFHSTGLLIETTKPLMVKRGIIGKDLNKLGETSEKEPIPEAIGLIPALVFLFVTIHE